MTQYTITEENLLEPEWINLLHPDWQKAWKLDDPEWVKQRKQDWAAIKRAPAFVSLYLPAKEKAILKRFFMTGCGIDPKEINKRGINPSFNPTTTPLAGMKRADRVLHEVWLTANQSEEHIQSILARSEDRTIKAARRELSAMFRSYNNISTQDELKTEKTLFAGSDQRLYETFSPLHLYATTDYAAFSQEAMKKNGYEACWVFLNIIVNYLSDDYYPQNIAPVVLNEWLTSLPHAVRNSKAKMEKKVAEGSRKPYDHFKSLREDCLVRALYLLGHPDDFDDVQVELAKQIVDGFRSMTVNEEVDQQIKELLLTAGI